MVLDVFLNLDDTILTVGIPLWAVTRTDAPHAVIPAVMVINTLMCVFLQMPVSARWSAPAPQPGRRAGTAWGCSPAAP